MEDKRKRTVEGKKEDRRRGNEKEEGRRREEEIGRSMRGRE